MASFFAFCFFLRSFLILVKNLSVFNSKVCFSPRRLFRAAADFAIRSSRVVVILFSYSKSSVFPFGRKLSLIASASILSRIGVDINFFTSSGSMSFLSQTSRTASMYDIFFLSTAFSIRTLNLDLVRNFDSIIVAPYCTYIVIEYAMRTFDFTIFIIGRYYAMPFDF